MAISPEMTVQAQHDCHQALQHLLLVYLSVWMKYHCSGLHACLLMSPSCMMKKNGFMSAVV